MKSSSTSPSQSLSTPSHNSVVAIDVVHVLQAPASEQVWVPTQLAGGAPTKHDRSAPARGELHWQEPPFSWQLAPPSATCARLLLQSKSHAPQLCAST